MPADNRSTNKLKVAMLGPSGVGKTALLTVMSRELGKTSNPIDLRLSTDSESQAILDKHYEALQMLVQSFESSGNTGLQGTTTPRDFLFQFDRKGWLGKRDSLKLEFLDIPGGYLSSQTTPENKNYYIEAVANSGATIVVIDTIALMHNKGRFNEQRNQVREVTQLIKDAYQNLSEPKLLIFVPIKCETYLLEGKDPHDIGVALKKAYDELLRHLLPRSLQVTGSSQVAIAITPVKTVGCVIYAGWKADPYGGVEDWYLSKTYEDAPMQTEYADIPLRHLLSFLMCQYLSGQGGLFGRFKDFFGGNEDLKDAIKRFADVPRMDVPIEILQGGDLLKIRD